MKSLERRFKIVESKHPSWSTYICFAMAVCGQNFNRSIIHRWFYKLVDRDDYASDEVKDVLGHIEILNNKVEDDKK